MEEQDLPELAAAPLPPEAAGETPETETEETPSDHPDGKRPVSWEEKRLSASVSQPEGLLDFSGQDFTFLEVSGEDGASDFACCTEGAQWLGECRQRLQMQGHPVL